MAPHSSTLAWKIPWTEEPGGLQSMGSQLIDFTFTFHFHALEKEMAETNFKSRSFLLKEKRRQVPFPLLSVRTGMQASGEGNGTPLQYSCLENPMDEGAWWAAVHGVAKSRIQLSDFPFTFFF